MLPVLFAIMIAAQVPQGPPQPVLAPRVAAPNQIGGLKIVTTNLRAQYLRMNGVPVSEKAVITDYYDWPGILNLQEQYCRSRFRGELRVTARVIHLVLDDCSFFYGGDPKTT